MMFKKLVSAFLVTALSLSLAVSVCAEEKEKITDYANNVIYVEAKTLTRSTVNFGDFTLKNGYIMAGLNNNSSNLFFSAGANVSITVTVETKNLETNIGMGHKLTTGSFVSSSFSTTKISGGYRYTCVFSFTTSTEFQPYVANNTAAPIDFKNFKMSY